MSEDFSHDIKHALEVLLNGGTILYPTDTIWGIGCDATNSAAVKKVFKLKQRDDSKAPIILLDDETKLKKYVSGYINPGLLNNQQRPVTIIYENARNLAPELITKDNTIAIRLVKDDFCKELIHQFGKPIVSTSANISGSAFPQTYKDINSEIKNGVDYIVQHRRNDLTDSKPSSIFKLKNDGTVEVIRE